MCDTMRRLCHTLCKHTLHVNEKRLRTERRHDSHHTLFQILGISYILYVIQDITRIYVETPTSACDVERVISNRLLTQELEAAKSPTRSHRVATILGHVELNTQMHGGCCATLPQI